MSRLVRPAQCQWCSGVAGRHTTTCPETTGLYPTDGGWSCPGCGAVVHGSYVLVDGAARCCGCGAHAAIRKEAG